MLPVVGGAEVGTCRVLPAMIFVPVRPLADWMREMLELYFAAMLESDSPGWIWWVTNCSPSRREKGAGAAAVEFVAATAGA